MAQESKGFRRKTRRKLTRGLRERITITKLMEEFNIGEKVIIKIHPSIHDGMPHPRFHGRAGEIIERRGDCYVVKIKDGDKEKKVIAHIAHLMRR